MENATANPATVLLLGGTSEIGLAIVEEYLRSGSLRAILAARPSQRRDEAAAALRRAGATVDVLDFDATAFETHPAVIDAAWEIAEVDLAIVAFGVLGDPDRAWQNQADAVALAQVNYTGAVSVGVLLGQKMKAIGRGQIIALSSVAGEVVRRSNFVYGSSKAGFDGFYRLLGEALAPYGPTVLVVRPGQVRTKLLAGVRQNPGAIAPEALARAVVDAARRGRTLIRVPGYFRVLMGVLKHLPRPVARRLPF